MTTTIDHILAVSPVSPDRSELLVVKIAMVGSDGELQLWSQPLPAGAPHRVGNISNLIVANWTPDGHIVYPQGDTIMIANRDGSEPRQLAKVHGSCSQSGSRRMAGVFALMLPTGEGTSARYGKWTGMEMGFARSFRIGKELSIAVETGRLAANIIISRRGAGTHRESG